MLDGNEVPAESSDDIQELLKKISPGVQLGSNISFFKLNKEHAVEVGRQIEIVAFEILRPSVEFANEIKRVSLHISYESLYGEKLEYDTRTHF